MTIPADRLRLLGQRPLPALTPEERGHVASALISLFEKWRLPTADQLALLGLHEDSRQSLRRYKQGHPLANNMDLLERAGHLFAIHESLRILFHEPDLCYGWMTHRIRSFGDRTPITVIREEGFRGLLRVRAYLDHHRGR